MATKRDDLDYHVALIRLVGAYFKAGSVKGAAELIGIGQQTAKNMLYQGRAYARVANNDELVRHFWKALARHGVREEFGLSQRKLRYHFDDEYREKVRKMARDGMRKKRRSETTGLQAHYDRLIVTQGNVCAVCGMAEGARRNKDGKPVRLSVDHDHQSGAIRELLCSGCNLMLGCAKDDPVRLEKGAAYLRRHAQATSHKNNSEAA